MKNKYHLSLHLQFEKDCDVDKIEGQLGIVSYKKNSLKDSLGKNKTAKLWFKTEDFEKFDAFSVFDGFILKMQDKFATIKSYLEAYKGKAVLTLYFEELKQKPYIKLSDESLKILGNNNIGFEVDFRI